MLNFTKAVELIQNETQEGLDEGIQLLFLSKYVQKIVKYFAQKYYRHLNPLEWEDLLIEAIYRFVNSLQKGKGYVKSPKWYFRSICRNICEEHKREKERMEIALDVLTKLLKHPGKQVERGKVFAALKKLGGQCEIILKLRYFNDEPIDNPIELAERLNANKYNVKASSIPAILTRCKANFRNLLGENPSSLFED